MLLDPFIIHFVFLHNLVAQITMTLCSQFPMKTADKRSLEFRPKPQTPRRSVHSEASGQGPFEAYNEHEEPGLSRCAEVEQPLLHTDSYFVGVTPLQSTNRVNMGFNGLNVRSAVHYELLVMGLTSEGILLTSPIMVSGKLEVSLPP